MSTSRSWNVAALTLAGALIVFGLAQAQTETPLEITPGYNFLKTPRAPASYTTLDVPAGFFGEKNGIPSDPIAGLVVPLEGGQLESLPLEPRSSIVVDPGNCHSGGGHYHCHEDSTDQSAVDTITKIGGITLASLGATGTVPLEIVALSLQAAVPVKVTYGNEQPPSFFGMVLTLDDSMVQEVGSILFNRTQENAGTMEVVLPVNFQVVFSGEAGTFGPVALTSVLESTDNGFTARPE